MSGDYPYLEFIRAAKECRNILIEDTFSSNSPDLYDALYSDSKSQIHRVKLELYEMKWIELHWGKIDESIENRVCSSKEKKEMVVMFAQWYRDFVSNWSYVEFDTVIFEEKINILKALISVNNKWEKNLKRMKVSFEQSKKLLNKKIEGLGVEET